jgi:hypothetical protein
VSAEGLQRATSRKYFSAVWSGDKEQRARKEGAQGVCVSKQLAAGHTWPCRYLSVGGRTLKTDSNLLLLHALSIQATPDRGASIPGHGCGAAATAASLAPAAALPAAAGKRKASYALLYTAAGSCHLPERTQDMPVFCLALPSQQHAPLYLGNSTANEDSSSSPCGLSSFVNGCTAQ